MRKACRDTTSSTLLGFVVVHRHHARVRKAVDNALILENFQDHFKAFMQCVLY